MSAPRVAPSAGSKRLLLLATGIGALLVLAALGWRHEPARAPVVARAPSDGVARNVVLVVGCTVRADQTTPYGGSTLATPFLDEVAREGTRFAATIAQAPWTRPATAAIVTGRHPIAIGLTEPGPGLNRRVLPDDVETLAERMKASGRRTWGATGNPNAARQFGFAQGFDDYWDGALDFQEGARKVPGRRLVERALRWVDAGEGPFYLQLLLVDAHQPDGSGLAALRFLGPGVPRNVAGYRAMLQRFDAAARALWEGLEARGLGEDTVLVVVGDHGEGLLLPPHHGKGHGNALYPSTVHVPWLVRGPGVARGHVVEGVAAQVDVVPTLLGLLELPSTSPADGADLSPALRGAPETGVPSVYTETWYRRADRGAVYTATRFCQRDFDPAGSARFAAGGVTRGLPRPAFADACYDWRVDPDATRPVDDPELHRRVGAVREELSEERRRHGEAPTADPSLDDALRALGYVGDGP